MNEELLRTTDHIAVREGPLIRVQALAKLLTLVGGIILFIAAVLIFPAREFLGPGLGERICFWFGIVLGVFALLYLGKAAFRVFLSPDFTLDTSRGMAILGGKSFPLRELSPPEIEEYRLGDFPMYKMTMELGGSRRTLINAVDRKRLKNLQTVADAIAESVQRDGFADPTETQAIPNTASTEKMQRFFFGGTLTAVGAAFFIIGYFIFPGLELVSWKDLSTRVLFWPLGIWVAVPGLLQFAGVPVYRVIVQERKSWKEYLLIALWFGSYFLLFARTGS